MNENFDEKKAVAGSDVQKQISEIDAAIAKYTELIKASEAREMAVDTVADSTFKKKMIAMALITCFAFLTFISSTFAYFTASTASSGNVIAAGGVAYEFVDLVYPSDSDEGISVEETVGMFSALPGEDIKRSVFAVNRGGTSIYVRARVESNITLKEEYAQFSDQIDSSLILYEVDGSWLVRNSFDGYYYYETALARGDKSPDFIKNISFSNDMGNIYKGATVAVKVVFEMVQANGNGETVFDAVGWPASEEGGNV